VFADSRANAAASLEHFQTAVYSVRASAIFGDQNEDTFNRPNAHTSCAHLADSADRFALPKNFDVRTYETNHYLKLQIYKYSKKTPGYLVHLPSHACYSSFDTHH
jgi:hypothetical protein